VTRLQRFSAGVWPACAGAILACCAGDDLRVVPLDKTTSQGKRVTALGVERWAHVLGETRELRFGGTPFEGCDLVWTCAALGSNPAAHPTMSVSWEDEDGKNSEQLLVWPSESAQSGSWSEIRVPLGAAPPGDAVFRLPRGPGGSDSVAIVAPRLESGRLRRTRLADCHNVVLVVLDTFRFDYISRYGSSPTATPNLDRFLAGTIEFLDAYTRTTFTLPSHVSMMTGLPPRSHGVRTNLQALDRSVRTIPLLLQEIGYRTGGFCELSTLSEQTGFARGFDTYVMCCSHLHQILPAVASWLQTVGDRPFFLLVNLGGVHVARTLPRDVHQLTCGFQGEENLHLRAEREVEVVRFVFPPGVSTVRFKARRWSDKGRCIDDRPLPMAIWNLRVSPKDTLEWCWASDVERPKLVRYLLEPPDWTDQDIVFHGSATLRVTNVGQDTTLGTLRFRAYPDFSQVLDQDKTQYALATSALDETVGELLAVLDRYSNPESTIVILTSDHGEGLEDHRDRLHGHEVFVETAHVPLAMRVPSCRSRSIKGLVSLDALAPTILDLAGYGLATRTSERSLVDDGREAAGWLLSETYDAASAAGRSPRPRDRALRTLDWSLVLDDVRRETCLYDRRADPFESTNLARLRPELVDSLAALLGRAVSAQPAVYPPGPLSRDPELRGRLRALGYVE
jgi:arylsulfatase A-like enzyme